MFLSFSAILVNYLRVDSIVIHVFTKYKSQKKFFIKYLSIKVILRKILIIC